MNDSTPSRSAGGVFIVFEGGDGVGKSTQVDLLAQWFVAKGRDDVVVTREPGGTGLGDKLRLELLHGNETVGARAEALLFAADRAEHVAEVIRPAVERGAIVISDRYVDSSVAYQVQGRGLAEADVRAINDFGTGGLRPDLVVLLDLDAAAAARRRAGDPDRMERAGEDFHRRVNAHYRQIAAGDPERYAVIDAAQPIEQIHDQVKHAIAARLGL